EGWDSRSRGNGPCLWLRGYARLCSPLTSISLPQLRRDLRQIDPAPRLERPPTHVVVLPVVRTAERDQVAPISSGAPAPDVVRIARSRSSADRAGQGADRLGIGPEIPRVARPAACR